jgi:hypothetical protein
LSVEDFPSTPFALEALPDSFRFDRRVEAFGINCGVKVSNGVFRTSDAPHRSRFRPEYWASNHTVPDLTFDTLAVNPLASADAMIIALSNWSEAQWSDEALDKRASDDNWSKEMRDEASLGSNEFRSEFARKSSVASSLLSYE